jgi:hypothetical protein
MVQYSVQLLGQFWMQFNIGKTSKSVVTARKTAAALRRLETELASKISAG